MTTAATWLPELDRILVETLDRIPDDDLALPTALPGWSRAHVLAHLDGNAEALCRLLDWASTGVESAMYESTARRNEEIEEGAALPPDKLRARTLASARRFTRRFAALTDEQRRHEVVTARGRHIPAAELAWLRCRELGIHAVDLAAGTGFDDLPAGFLEALTGEIMAQRLTGGQAPALAAWLSGRSPGTELGPWI